MLEAFNKAEKDRSKLNDLLVKTQDRAAERISAVKSQLESQRKARSDLETSLTERTGEITQLQYQVSVMGLAHKPQYQPNNG